MCLSSGTWIRREGGDTSECTNREDDDTFHFFFFLPPFPRNPETGERERDWWTLVISDFFVRATHIL